MSPVRPPAIFTPSPHHSAHLLALPCADWHDKVARGEEAAPFPEPKLIEAVPKPEGTLPEKTITDFGFMDDDDEGQIKLYIKLEGDLESVTKDDVDLKVESRWGNASMTASLKGQKFMHVLGAEKLMHDVIPEECKVKVLTKKQKCVIVLQKRGDPKMPWEGANSALGTHADGHTNELHASNALGAPMHTTHTTMLVHAGCMRTSKTTAYCDALLTSLVFGHVRLACVVQTCVRRLPSRIGAAEVAKKLGAAMRRKESYSRRYTF